MANPEPIPIIGNLLNYLKDEHLHRLGVDRYETGLPVQPPGSPVSAYLYMDGIDTPTTTLVSTVAVLQFAIRIYYRYDNVDTRTKGTAEVRLAETAARAMKNLIDDHALHINPSKYNLHGSSGPTVRNIDITGEFGRGMMSRWIFEETPNFRVVEVSVPIVVDDLFTTS